MIQGFWSTQLAKEDLKSAAVKSETDPKHDSARLSKKRWKLQVTEMKEATDENTVIGYERT